GAGLTNVQLSGPLPLALLPASVLTNGSSGVLTNGSSSVILNGTFSGDGTGLTNVQLSGPLPLALLPASLLTNGSSGVLTNGSSGVNLSGSFAGNAMGLTNVPYQSVQGNTAIVVSPNGIANGKSTIPNNGCPYGIDTPGTLTCGIQEALNAL